MLGTAVLKTRIPIESANRVMRWHFVLILQASIWCDTGLPNGIFAIYKSAETGPERFLIGGDATRQKDECLPGRHGRLDWIPLPNFTTKRSSLRIRAHSARWSIERTSMSLVVLMVVSSISWACFRMVVRGRRPWLWLGLLPCENALFFLC